MLRSVFANGPAHVGVAAASEDINDIRLALRLPPAEPWPAVVAATADNDRAVRAAVAAREAAAEAHARVALALNPYPEDVDFDAAGADARAHLEAFWDVMVVRTALINREGHVANVVTAPQAAVAAAAPPAAAAAAAADPALARLARAAAILAAPVAALPYLTLAYATKANLWMINHHVGQGELQGYALKAAHVLFRGAPRATLHCVYKLMWRIGHWIDTRSVFSVWLPVMFPQGRTHAATRDSTPLPSADLTMRLASNPAGTATVMDVFTVLHDLVTGPFARVILMCQDWEEIATAARRVRADPLRFHMARHHWAGQPRVVPYLPCDATIDLCCDYLKQVRPLWTIKDARCFSKSLDSAGQSVAFRTLRALKEQIASAQADLALTPAETAEVARARRACAGELVFGDGVPVPAAPADAGAAAAGDAEFDIDNY